MIVQFLNELQVAEIDDENWQLLTPFQADIDGRILTVPAGFKTDFASIPRLPIVYEAFGNKAHKPAVLHDYLYSLGGTDADREYADSVLWHGALADGMDKVKAWDMWLAVRGAGASHWKAAT